MAWIVSYWGLDQEDTAVFGCVHVGQEENHGLLQQQGGRGQEGDPGLCRGRHLYPFHSHFLRECMTLCQNTGKSQRCLPWQKWLGTADGPERGLVRSSEVDGLCKHLVKGQKAVWQGGRDARASRRHQADAAADSRWGENKNNVLLLQHLD